KNRLDREIRIFRCDFDGGYLFEIKPSIIQVRGLALHYTRAHYPFTHTFILPVTESPAWRGDSRAGKRSFTNGLRPSAGLSSAVEGGGVCSLGGVCPFSWRYRAAILRAWRQGVRRFGRVRNL